MAKNGRTAPIPVIRQTDAQLLGMVPQAVDQISADAATQIEGTAKQLVENAQLVAEKLQKLAEAIREHGRIAEEHVSKFCGDAKHILDVAARLQTRLLGEEAIEHEEPPARLPEAPQLPDIE